MKRRDFLHLAIATTAVGTGPLFARQQQAGPVGASDRIRAAIVGCGNRGRAVAREWIEHADTTFVAACDVDRTRTDATVAEFAQAGHKAEGYEDYRRILERKDVDALLIATPDHWHSPMTIEAIAAGKDVYCEKPVSNTVEAAVRMRDAARRSTRIIQIGTQQRSWTHFVEAARLFHENYIGTAIRHVVMSPPGGGGGGAGATALPPPAAQTPAEPVPEGFNWDLFQGPAPRRPFLAARRGWRGWYAYGGGGITDWGVHLVDVMAWFMKLDNKAPLLTSASAQYVNQTRDPERTPNTYAVTWQFENFVATLSNAMIPGVEQPEENYGNWFHGNRGVMLVNRFGYDIRPIASGGGRGGGRGRGEGGRGGRGDAGAAGAGAPPAAAPPPPIEPKRVWDPTGRSEARGTEFAFATRRHVRNFLDSVKSRQKPVCDMEAGFAASLPCLLANVAIQQERTVKWDGNKAT
ncbi:MAG TPA: Gfo/Idh/MocA family oxidoreductase [Vicinamibacterales bacterium]|nr:Gfo/Idh/MocA family oxidoreductase [Vicinamibacterales bacterium]